MGQPVSVKQAESAAPAPIDRDSIRRILVTAYGHIADTLPAFAALRALREAFPHARITVLAVDYVREMFESCPDVDATLAFKDFRYKNTRRGKIETLIRLAQLLPRVYGRYDMALVLHARTRFLTRLAWLTGARVRAGLPDVAGPGMLTHPARPLPALASFRAENRRALEAVGVTSMGSGLEFEPPEHEVAAARQMLLAEGVREGERVIGLHPGSHWTCQQWSPADWSAVADELVNRYDARLVITGSQDERGLAEEIIAGMRASDARVINAAGRTSIIGFFALVKALTCLVCVNSAASQVALATRTPVVNLVGYENPIWTAPVAGEPMTIVRGCDDTSALSSWCPYGVWGKLSECHRAECVGIGGMSLIRRDLVVREVGQWLNGESAPGPHVLQGALTEDRASSMSQNGSDHHERVG